MFAEIEEKQVRKIICLRPVPPVSDRAFWDGLDEAWKTASLALGEQYLGYRYPNNLATDFMRFVRTGNREIFEARLFANRHALNALVLAECVENKGRFLDDIVNGIFSACEESGWQLPAHNNGLPLPDAGEPVLDLFACETGAILATALFLLEDELDQISPVIGRRIRDELERRIYRPYLERHFWWMGNGKDRMNNWTIWCTQNVLLSAFLVSSDKARNRRILKKACQSIDHFLDAYGEDGCCDEGAQYYRHAGLCLFQTMEVLNAVTDNAFAPLYREKKIKNIASYFFHVHVQGSRFINFSDCSPIAGSAGARDFLFGERTENAAMMAFAARSFVESLPESLTLPKENSLYDRLQQGVCAARMKEYDRGNGNRARFSPPDIYYESTGLFVARDERICLAVKAGGNGDSHNHNDTGSFILYQDGKPVFVDVGVETYTKQTFSPQRYELWTMQSQYHNLPTIDGMMQKDGASYCAKDVVCRLGEEVCSIQMDLSGAYPDGCKAKAFLRIVCLQKQKGVTVKDRVIWKKEKGAVIWNLMTEEKPVPAQIENRQGDDKWTFSLGDRGTFWVEGAALLGVEEIPIKDPRLRTAWKEKLYRIRLLWKADEAQMQFDEADDAEDLALEKRRALHK